MNHDFVKLSEILDMPVTVHRFVLTEIIFYQITLVTVNLKFTYMVSRLGSIASPNNYGVAKLAKNVSFIHLSNVLCNVVQFRQIKMDMLVGHSIEHHFYI